MRNDTAMIGSSSYERQEDDFYPTIDERVTEVLFENLRWVFPESCSFWECAAGDGRMSDVIKKHSNRVFLTDINPRREDIQQLDFYESEKFADLWRPDVIITNPPYGKHVQKFIERGLSYMPTAKIDMLCILARNEYDCGVTRKHLFGENNNYYGKIVLTWRPKWFTDGTSSPRHNYAWYIWKRRDFGRHIPLLMYGYK